MHNVVETVLEKGVEGHVWQEKKPFMCRTVKDLLTVCVSYDVIYYNTVTRDKLV